MPLLKMLIGLPGSGKTTYAKKVVETEAGWIHLSSDEIAKNLFAPNEPVNHQVVFSSMYHETASALEAGLNVIYDATNLSSKKRRNFLNRIQKQQAETEAVLFLTPYAILKERNQRRGDVDRVPEHVIDRYIKSFQFPKRDENFHKLTILYGQSLTTAPIQKIRTLFTKPDISYEEFLCIYEAFDETKPLLKLEPITRQTHQVFNSLRKETQDPIERELLSWTALLYCIGKPYVRKNLPLEEDNFYGYQHISWYLAYPILLSLSFPEAFVFDVLFIIDEHREALNSRSGKTKRKIGLENYERMQLLWRVINESKKSR